MFPKIVIATEAVVRLVKKILLFVVVLLVLVAIGGWLLPSQVHVQRSITVAAHPTVVYGLVNDLHAFNQWSPWSGLDPTTEYAFTGPSSGVGAKMQWKSNNPRVGTGSQEITLSTPEQRVEVKLSFGSQQHAMAYYELSPNGSGTDLTWGFVSHLGYNPYARYFGLMFDKWLGNDYELGLAKLKKLAEDKQQILLQQTSSI